MPGGQGPQAASILKTVNDWTNDITSVVLAAFAGTDCESPNIRTGNGTETSEQAQQRRDMALECAAEAMYEVTVYTPWAVGMIGKYERAPRGADGKRGEPTQDQVLAERILRQKAYSFADIAANGDNFGNYTDARTRDGRDMRDDICDDVPEADRPMNSYSGKSCDRSKMRQETFGVNDDQLAEPRPRTATCRRHRTRGTGRTGAAASRASGSTSPCSPDRVVLDRIDHHHRVVGIPDVADRHDHVRAHGTGGFPLRPDTRVRCAGIPPLLELLLGTFVKRIVLGLFVGLLMALYSVVLTIDMRG